MLIRLLRTHLRPYRGRLVVLVALQIVATLAMLYLPSLNGRIIDEGVTQGDTGRIVELGAVMLVVGLAQIGLTIGATYLAARTAAQVGRDVRHAVFTRVAEFSSHEVGRFGPPTLISRSTNDITQVQNVTFMAAAVMVTIPIMMLGGVGMALHEDAGLAWLMAVSVPVLAISVGLLISRMVPQFRLMQTAVDKVNRVLREQIIGIRVVRAFVREPQELHRFDGANTEYTGAAFAVAKLMAFAQPIVLLVVNGSMIAVVWFGGVRVDNGQMQVGSLIAFMAYLMFVLMSVMMATFMATMIPRASVSAGRIVEVLDTEPSVAAPTQPQSVPEGPVAVELSGVEFTYPGAAEPVLRGIDLVAEPGSTTAIIGSTGAGKSTVLGLIARLYDTTGGVVRVGGVDVRDADPDHLWGRIGLVPQRAYLFSGTVADNLRFGNPEATDDQMWEALRIAAADDFVAAMPDGLNAPIAQGGTNVSGGQRQRLAIARAVIGRPPIYLFDDAFSALDTATDAAVRDSLGRITGQATVVVVAQRVSTIVSADRIVVLDNGAVVGLGRHEELIQSCPTYLEIVRSQTVAEEVR